MEQAKQEILEELHRTVRELTLKRDFPFSIFKASTWRIGAGIFAVLFALFAGLDYLDPAVRGQGISISSIGNIEYLVISFLIAYVMVANEHGRSHFVEEMLALSPVLKTSINDQINVFAGQTAWRQKGRAFTGVALNLITMPVLYPILMSDDVLTLGTASLFVSIFLLQFVVGNALFDMFDLYIRVRRLTEKGFEIDLLDLSPLDSFGRMGLATAGKVAFGCAIAVPLMLDTDTTLVTGGIVAFMVIIGIAVLVLPTRTVRLAIRAEKETVLSEVNDRIRHEYQQNKGDYDIAGLIAYRDLVRGINEWPFSIPFILRFGVIGVVPILSWFAAAFVEQIVDRFIG